MSDQTPDPGDDVLRAALEAEAAGVAAGPELFGRVQGAAAGPAIGRRRTPWLLTAAAATAVVVAIVAVWALESDDQRLNVIDDPTTSTVARTPTTSSTTTAPLPRELPLHVARVGVDGRLTFIDLSGGPPIDLADLGDPRDDVTGANTISSVSLSPDGTRAYFGSCCPAESRQGDIWRVPTDASAPAVRIAAGYDPAADPSGSYLAIADPVEGHLFVTTIDGDRLHQLDDAGAVTDPDWSPDGRRVAFTDETIDGGRVVVVDFDPEVGFGAPRVLPGVTDAPVWLDNDRLIALDRSGGCTGCAYPEQTQIVRLTLDGTELDRGPLTVSVVDLAGSHDRRSVLSVRSDGLVEIQYTEAAPGAGFGAVAQGTIAADW